MKITTTIIYSIFNWNLVVQTKHTIDVFIIIVCITSICYCYHNKYGELGQTCIIIKGSIFIILKIKGPGVHLHNIWYLYTYEYTSMILWHVQCAVFSHLILHNTQKHNNILLITQSHIEMYKFLFKFICNLFKCVPIWLTHK